MRRHAIGMGLLAGAGLVLSSCTILWGFQPFTLADEDASVNVAIAEAMAPAVEGGAATDARFCATRTPTPTFCDDFERTDLLGGLWDSQQVSSSGTVAIQSNALVTTIPLYTTGDIGRAGLERAFGVATRVSYGFRLRVDAPPPNDNFEAMALTVTIGGDSFNLHLGLESGALVFVEQTFPEGGPSTYEDHPLTVPITFGSDHRVEIVAKLTAPPRSTVFVDGKVAWDADAPAFFRPGRAQIAAGLIDVFSPAGPDALHIDDVVVDLE
jgi:hypothetical protein